jgi:hypothetical protein
MRRAFLKGLALGSVAWREALAAEAPGEKDRRLAALEVVRVEGRREVRQAHLQHQVNPAHVWAPPAEYHEPDDAPLHVVPASAIYVKARTQGGLEGLYGPIEHEQVPVLVRDLAPFLAGRDPLAVETLWDRMYRSNRHARAGHFMMAISAADNVLWDLRGRLLGLPVFRLLGGSRDRVPVYASCLGFSLEPGRAEEKARSLRAEGWRAQKWFLAHGPAEGREGLVKNVDLVRRLREAAGETTDLMFDAYMGWDLPYALAWAKAVGSGALPERPRPARRAVRPRVVRRGERARPDRGPRLGPRRAPRAARARPPRGAPRDRQPVARDLPDGGVPPREDGDPHAPLVLPVLRERASADREGRGAAHRAARLRDRARPGEGGEAAVARPAPVASAPQQYSTAGPEGWLTVWQPGAR